MGIYIKGMEMPDKKNGAVLIFYPNGKVCYEDGTEYKAVELPPHGRLIDADAYAFPGDLIDCPTIIPADKEADK